MLTLSLSPSLMLSLFLFLTHSLSNSLYLSLSLKFSFSLPLKLFLTHSLSHSLSQDNNSVFSKVKQSVRLSVKVQKFFNFQLSEFWPQMIFVGNKQWRIFFLEHFFAKFNGPTKARILCINVTLQDDILHYLTWSYYACDQHVT